MSRSTLPFYVGGTLGPFGGSMLVSLIPNVASGLDASLSLVALSLSAYTVPFAVFQLVSGTLGERLGPVRVVRAGFAVYGVAALLAAAAPEIWSFVGARALMGTANAFLTPILLAGLSEVVSRESLGRTVGTFAAWQTGGFTLAPVLGGLIGEVSWRLAFVLVALVSFGLLIPRQRFGAAGEGRERATLRSLLNRWTALLAAKAALGFLGFVTIGFVLVLVADDEFGLSSSGRGLLVALSGLGGILTGRFAGGLSDRLGRPQTALLGALLCGAGVLGLGFAPTLWSLGLIYFGIGCAAPLVWASLNLLALESSPGNRAGTLSAFSAFKFVGGAIGPLIYFPLYELAPRSPFLLASGFTLLLALLTLPWLRRAGAIKSTQVDAPSPVP